MRPPLVAQPRRLPVIGKKLAAVSTVEAVGVAGEAKSPAAATVTLGGMRKQIPTAKRDFYPPVRTAHTVSKLEVCFRGQRSSGDNRRRDAGHSGLP